MLISSIHQLCTVHADRLDLICKVTDMKCRNETCIVHRWQTQSSLYVGLFHIAAKGWIITIKHCKITTIGVMLSAVIVRLSSSVVSHLSICNLSSPPLLRNNIPATQLSINQHRQTVTNPLLTRATLPNTSAAFVSGVHACTGSASTSSMWT